MKTVKIVIGANFGDEGKGLMTDYFAGNARARGQSCLTVCHNGGCQRGHTVVSPAGLRHVFHHFGSGSMEGADTYLASEFIVNPILFCRELCVLEEKGIRTKCYVNGDCLLTTPFDMMLNQIVEEYRGAGKHGSCGLGIFETLTRSERSGMRLTVHQAAAGPAHKIRDLLGQIASDYLAARLQQLGVDRLPAQWREILDSRDQIIGNYMDDLEGMIGAIAPAGDDIIKGYDCVIFEGAQGLLLDKDNLAYMPHLTPSSTGIRNPLKILHSAGWDADAADMEACYVSRTYMTRHGAGRFDTECKKEDIDPDMTDLTNIPNPYQDSLRYGLLDLEDLKSRIEKDLGGQDLKKSVALTHCNEYHPDAAAFEELFSGFGRYLSDGPTRSDVVLRGHAF